MKIPLTKPYWGKKEEGAVIDALKTSTGVGDGPFSKKLAAKLRELTSSPYVFPVTSCTHGLELAMAALGVSDGDEIIMPSFTMTSTANCVVLRGGQPVFADIEERNFAIDPADIRRKITNRTKGIIVVHYGGIPCAIEEILEIVKEHHLFVVEDAAHTIGAYYKGKMLGTFGDVGVYSFHGTKNISCGEGGAVVTNRKDLAEKMEIFRANGTNRSAFLRGDVDKYSWVGMGSSYFLSDILCSLVLTQVNQIHTINKKRTQIATYYTKSFSSYSTLLTLPAVPQAVISNWHIFPLLFHSKENARIFLTAMREKGIEVSTHYVPLHTSPMGKRLNLHIKLPVTEDVSTRLVRLPIYPGLTNAQLKYIDTSAQLILSHM